MFSLISGLPSPFSADPLPSLFEGFIGTMSLSDSSETYMRAVRPKPSPAGLRSACPAVVPEVSRFSCQKFLGVPGVYDYAGPSGKLALSFPVHVAFRLAKDVGALMARFRSSIPSPPIPLFTLRCAPHDTQRKTRGRVDRYSFLARISFLSSSASCRFIPAHQTPSFGPVMSRRDPVLCTDGLS